MVAFGIMFSMAWSGIHTGRTDRPEGLEIALAYVALLCAVAVPFGLGFFAARATHRAMGGKKSREIPADGQVSHVTDEGRQPAQCASVHELPWSVA